MDAVGPDGEGHVQPVVDDERHPERRHEGLDPSGLLDEETGRNVLFPELDADGPAPDRLENDIRKRLSRRTDRGR